MVVLKADPDTAPIVAELFRRRASQASYRELAADLNEGAEAERWTGLDTAQRRHDHPEPRLRR